MDEKVDLADGRAPGGQGAKFEPASGYCYSGAGQCMESVAAMIHALPDERKPVLVALYESLNAGEYWRNPDIMEAHNVFPGTILQIGLQLPLHNDDDLRAIGDGGYDEQIGEMAGLYKSVKLPVFLRIGYEFDGEWNGYKPELYKSAYRRIVDRFRESGADNVAFVWNTYIADNRSAFDWYPDDPATGERDGDNYVDWLSFNTITPNYYAAWFMEQAAALGKPVMIGESSYAIVKPTYTFEACTGDFMQMVKTYGIKGYQFINWKWQVYPENAQWHDWANGRFTDDAALVRHYNALMDDGKLIFRDSTYYNPVALFVDCARGLRQREAQDEGDLLWDKRFDHCTSRDGYDYQVKQAIVRYGDGWFPFHESVSDELEIALRVPRDCSGYLILNMNLGNGASLAAADEFTLAFAGREYELFSRKGGYHKIPLAGRSAVDEPVIVRLTNKKPGGKVKLAQFGVMVLSDDALPAPERMQVETDADRTRLVWEPVEGAYFYNVYRDSQLIAMTEKNEFMIAVAETGEFTTATMERTGKFTIPLPGGHRQSCYRVSAYDPHSGEGRLSAAVRGDDAMGSIRGE